MACRLLVTEWPKFFTYLFRWLFGLLDLAEACFCLGESLWLDLGFLCASRLSIISKGLTLGAIWHDLLLNELAKLISGSTCAFSEANSLYPILSRSSTMLSKLLSSKSGAARCFSFLLYLFSTAIPCRDLGPGYECLSFECERSVTTTFLLLPCFIRTSMSLQPDKA